MTEGSKVRGWKESEARKEERRKKVRGGKDGEFEKEERWG